MVLFSRSHLRCVSTTDAESPAGHVGPWRCGRGSHLQPPWLPRGAVPTRTGPSAAPSRPPRSFRPHIMRQSCCYYDSRWVSLLAFPRLKCFPWTIGSEGTTGLTLRPNTSCSDWTTRVTLEAAQHWGDIRVQDQGPRLGGPESQLSSATCQSCHLRRSLTTLVPRAQV